MFAAHIATYYNILCPPNSYLLLRPAYHLSSSYAPGYVSNWSLVCYC